MAEGGPRYVRALSAGLSQITPYLNLCYRNSTPNNYYYGAVRTGVPTNDAVPAAFLHFVYLEFTGRCYEIYAAGIPNTASARRGSRERKISSLARLLDAGLMR
ncbi:hypothetical protein EVAR_26629_1 [Eumeta japonica]|uniref:Uncharacterized protein n=1 Tax=Eumeta variegata TaxID=151549 RepID=A0A4C1XM78_EUMVA|nr:hypothetical protein EVAR_26629_1 [Eumeta japonica]